MGFAIVQSEPAIEPVSLSLAKSHLRIDTTEEDAWLPVMITAAREMCEEFCQRAFVSRTVVATFDRFPPWDTTGWDFWLLPGYPSPDSVYPNPLTRAIRLPIWPVISVETVKYYDSAGVQQTLVAGTDYLTHLTRMPALVYPTPGKFWKVTQFGRVGSVEVSFTAGLATVPKRLTAAMLLTLGYWWGHRGDGDDPTGSDATMRGLPAGAQRILAQMARFPYV